MLYLKIMLTVVLLNLKMQSFQTKSIQIKFHLWVSECYPYLCSVSISILCVDSQSFFCQFHLLKSKFFPYRPKNCEYYCVQINV